MNEKTILKILAFILIMGLMAGMVGCSKSEHLPDCANCSLVSYKYTDQWELVRIDTLWKGYVCGEELGKIIAVKKIDTLDFRNCPPMIPNLPEFKLEIRKYFIQ